MKNGFINHMIVQIIISKDIINVGIYPILLISIEQRISKSYGKDII